MNENIGRLKSPMFFLFEVLFEPGGQFLVAILLSQQISIVS